MARIFGCAGVVVLGLLATACPSPNLYGTPRTVPPGKLDATIALEGAGYRVKTKKQVESGYEWLPAHTYSDTLPITPIVIARVGVADRFDLGFHLNTFVTPGLDVKWNFVRSEVLDLAVDPGVEWAWIVARVHLPLLIGVNFSDKVSLILLPGLMYGMSNLSGDLGDASDFKMIMGADGWYGRAGVGFNLRVSKKVALQPELSVVKALAPSKNTVIFEDVLTYHFGFGATFGHPPEYGPPGPPPAPPAPTTQPNPPAPAASPSAAPPGDAEPPPGAAQPTGAGH